MALFPHARNFARVIVHNDCATPWFVYLETFAPAFIRMLITLHWLQWDDIARSIAESKAAPRGSRSARSLRHRVVSAAKGNQYQQERFAQKGLRHLLTITKPIEIIGFAWLLYSATDQFYLDWQTAIMFNSGCFNPASAGPLQRHRTGGSNISILPGGGATPLPILDQDRAGWGSGAFSCAVPRGSYHVIFALNLRGPSGGISGVRAKIRTTFSPLGNEHYGEPVSAGSFEDFSCMVSTEFSILDPGGSIGWELEGPAVPVGLLCYGARVIVMRTN